MSLDALPQFGLGTAALVIFLVCAAFVLLRGISRIIVGTLVFSASAWFGFRVWQEAPTILVEWFGKPLPWLANGLAISSFVLCWIILRKITIAISNPFRASGDRPRRSVFNVLFRLVCSIIPAAIIWIVGATFVHHNGSIAEVREFSDQPTDQGSAAPASYSERLKDSVEAAIPESWMQILDPFTKDNRITLAKWITAQSETPRIPVLDPRTGEPIPRAVVVDDPELQNLARRREFGTLLRHPYLTKALADPKVQSILRGLQL